jgi:SAM-dependent methyltransferase
MAETAVARERPPPYGSTRDGRGDKAMATAVSSRKLRESYEAELFAPLFAVEDRHFWFNARNRILEAAVAPLIASLPDGYRVLEAGCGTGFVLRMLERLFHRGEVIGLDPYGEALDFARRRVGCSLVQGDVFHWPFDEPFHLIGFFDVLEHLEDDVAALRQLRKSLTVGGRLVLTVPAHRALWSYADAEAHHCRRYGTSELTKALVNAGFEVEYMTQFMSYLYPIVWLTRRLARRGDGPARDRELSLRELRIVPIVNGVLRWLLSRDAFFVRRRWRLPLGTSLLAIARTSAQPR